MQTLAGCSCCLLTSVLQARVRVQSNDTKSILNLLGLAQQLSFIEQTPQPSQPSQQLCPATSSAAAAGTSQEGGEGS
jgi:hypothetical protein